MIWRISRRNSIIKWQGYRVSASRLAESNFRDTQGEALNAVKKMERTRLGVTGTNATLAQLAAELADVVIAADLLAMAAEIDLEEATREKFNHDSDRLGLQTKIGS
jgi:hypothetical protein